MDQSLLLLIALMGVIVSLYIGLNETKLAIIDKRLNELEKE